MGVGVAVADATEVINGKERMVFLWAMLNPKLHPCEEPFDIPSLFLLAFSLLSSTNASSCLRKVTLQETLSPLQGFRLSAFNKSAVLPVPESNFTVTPTLKATLCTSTSMPTSPQLSVISENP
jgi:hypothetical protein